MPKVPGFRGKKAGKAVPMPGASAWAGAASLGEAQAQEAQATSVDEAMSFMSGVLASAATPAPKQHATANDPASRAQARAAENGAVAAHARATTAAAGHDMTQTDLKGLLDRVDAHLSMSEDEDGPDFEGSRGRGGGGRRSRSSSFDALAGAASALGAVRRRFSGKRAARAAADAAASSTGGAAAQAPLPAVDMEGVRATVRRLQAMRAEVETRKRRLRQHQHQAREQQERKQREIAALTAQREKETAAAVAAAAAEENAVAASRHALSPPSDAPFDQKASMRLTSAAAHAADSSSARAPALSPQQRARLSVLEEHLHANTTALSEERARAAALQRQLNARVAEMEGKAAALEEQLSAGHAVVRAEAAARVEALRAELEEERYALPSLRPHPCPARVRRHPCPSYANVLRCTTPRCASHPLPPSLPTCVSQWGARRARTRVGGGGGIPEAAAL